MPHALHSVGRKIECGFAGSGENGDAGGWFQRIIQVALHGGAHLHQVSEVQMEIVEDVGDKAFRYGRSAWAAVVPARSRL